MTCDSHHWNRVTKVQINKKFGDCKTYKPGRGLSFAPGVKGMV